MSSSKKSTSSSKRSASPAVSFLLSPPPHSASSSRSYNGTIDSKKRDSRSLASATSAFTPRKLDISTTTPTSLLMPPSQTISEALTELASTTAAQLEEVWDELGYNPEERASQIADLVSAFRKLCGEKISEERGVAETFRQTIADAKDEMRAKSRALQKEVDMNLLENNPGQLSLTDELATLEITLETLRADAEDASAYLCDCRDKLLAAHASLGTELEEEWQDVSSDLTELRRAKFHQKVAEMDEVVATRTSATVQLLKDCQHLIRELQIDPHENPFDRKIHGSLVRNENDDLTVASTVETETCTGISAKVLDKLTRRIAELSGEKRRRKMRLGEMGTEIASLWEKLRIPEEEQRAFAESVKGLGMDTIEKGENELKRLNELKGKMLGKLIADAREQIYLLWEDISAGEEQKSSFDAIKETNESNFTDELLSEHEAYIRTLYARLDQMRPILRLIEKREEIIKERMEYERLQKDSDRLQQRGAALTKQLMKEEKMGRRIKKDLPKYTEVLEKKLHEWQNTHGEKFVFQGEVYYDLMSKQEEEWQTYKDIEMQLKLKKKQEEKVLEMDRANERWSKPLPGKKKNIHTSGKAVGGPLADAGSRTNVIRGPSRGRMAQDMSKNEGDNKRAVSAAPKRFASADSNRLRAVSRSRAQSAMRGGESGIRRPLSRP